MERFYGLNRYQKILALILVVLTLVFLGIYGVLASQEGFLYLESVLLMEQEGGSTVYAGTLRGQQCRFTVTADKAVTFSCGDRIYGPYTAVEAPDAIPKDHTFADLMTGVEVREGDAVIFRGGVVRMSGLDSLWLVNEDGADGSVVISAVTSAGTAVDSEGNPVDEWEPSVSTVLELMNGPQLTRKGDWAAWLLGAFLSVTVVVSMLYADEIFRWDLAFRIRNAEQAEPTEMEIAGRYFSWTAVTVIIGILYLNGLR